MFGTHRRSVGVGVGAWLTREVAVGVGRDGTRVVGRGVVPGSGLGAWIVGGAAVPGAGLLAPAIGKAISAKVLASGTKWSTERKNGLSMG